MKRVGFIVRPDKEGVDRLLARLTTWLTDNGHQAAVLAEDEIETAGAEVLPAERFGQSIDIAVVLGGDGTMLGASRLVAEHGVPILGVNLGRLGFLTPFQTEDAPEALAGAVNGELETAERMRLSVSYIPHEGEVVTRAALNDAVIHQGAMARLIELETTLDDERIAMYRADGLIIATPTGSTAYNLAAGGPILVPGQASMALTPICAHTLTNRPLVVPNQSTIRIRLSGESLGVVLTVDGQWATPVGPADRVEIRAADKPLVMFTSDKGYFDILRDKLHWDRRNER